MIRDAHTRRIVKALPAGELHVLFEVRSSSRSSQTGEICFPAGVVSARETKREAALRETEEELLVSRNQIELLDPLDVLVSPGGLYIWPYLGIIKDYQGPFSRTAVDHIFTVLYSGFLRRSRSVIKYPWSLLLKRISPLN